MSGQGSGSKQRIDNLLTQYRAEVLRWNTQINLVGRSNPATTLDSLVTHCRTALGVVITQPQELSTLPPNFLYCDIGSGAGLPGVVWHTILTDAGYGPHSFLIEPRNKRAWFLERVAAQLGLADLNVVAARWGETPLLYRRPERSEKLTDILLSIKALRITDAELLAGLEQGLSPTTSAEQWTKDVQRVIIVRFLPSGTREDPNTLNDLGTVNRSVHVVSESASWHCMSRRVQALPTPAIDSSILVSVFENTN